MMVPDWLPGVLRTHQRGLRAVAIDLEHELRRRTEAGASLDDLVPLSEARIEVHAALVHLDKALGLSQEPG